jgi:hypothetical protein
VEAEFSALGLTEKVMISDVNEYKGFLSLKSNLKKHKNKLFQLN